MQAPSFPAPPTNASGLPSHINFVQSQIQRAFQSVVSTVQAVAQIIFQSPNQSTFTLTVDDAGILSLTDSAGNVVPIGSGEFLPLAGGTLTGNLTIQYAGAPGIALDASAASADRPFLSLRKTGADRLVISCDGTTAGATYYEAKTATGFHQFFVNNVAVLAVIPTGLRIDVNGGLIFTAQTSGAASGAGTLTNAPKAGNPDFWLPVSVNGTAGWIPWWHA